MEQLAHLWNKYSLDDTFHQHWHNPKHLPLWKGDNHILDRGRRRLGSLDCGNIEGVNALVHNISRTSQTKQPLHIHPTISPFILISTKSPLCSCHPSELLLWSYNQLATTHLEACAIFPRQRRRVCCGGSGGVALVQEGRSIKPEVHE